MLDLLIVGQKLQDKGPETSRKPSNDRTGLFLIPQSLKLSLEWVKTISEYVWYDDHRAVDNGWIDFEPEEKERILGITAQ